MSRWRKLYLDLRIWLGFKLFEQPTRAAAHLGPPCVVNIGFGQILKAHSTRNEVAVMDWLIKNTAIPVPRLIGAYYRRGDYRRSTIKEDPVHCCLVMERMPGETLHQAWDKMSKEDLKEILWQLHDHIAELRGFAQSPAMEGHVCSFVNEALDEPALSNFGPVGPFTVPEFIDHLMNVAIVDRDLKEERFRDVLGRWLEGGEEDGLRLTHGDLHVNNILVQKVGKGQNKSGKGAWAVSGIIDWTMAGWYPIYWETYKAGYMPHDKRNWRAIAPLAFGMYEEEVQVLAELQSITFR